MELVFQCRDSGLRAMLVLGLGSERENAEREVLEAGLPLGLSHRAAWAENLYHHEPWFLLVRDENGRARAGVAIEQIRPRSLPGQVILRVEKFGGSLPPEVSRLVLQAIAHLTKTNPSILWSVVNVFSRDRRDTIGEVLKEIGFREVQAPSTYRYTLVIDLRPSEDAIFASFSTNARRRIRETTKMCLRSMVITDPIYAEKLKELQQQAFERTGGHNSSLDWRQVLKMSQEFPQLSRVAGLFLDEDTSPEKMEAFLWVCNHGDHVEYRAAGSTRRSDVRIPYGYQLAWEMIPWAKAVGAEWFDMGGVTLAEGDRPELDGISRFKRYFSRNVVEVGAEWVLEPSPVRARIAALVSSSASHVNRLMEELRTRSKVRIAAFTNLMS